MLTVEILRQNAAFAALSDEQLAAIAEMSRNDEQAVIGTRIGELHGQYDRDIFSITGIKKNDGEKSYDYMKRMLGKYKADLEASSGIRGELNEAKAKIVELTGKLEKGAGEDIQKQLNDARNRVSQLQEQLKAKETAFADERKNLENAIKGVHVDYAFAAATRGLKFKAGIPESAQKTLLKAAKDEVLAKGTPDFVDDGKGGRKLVLRGADGNVLNNAKNNLNPYTVAELVMETSIKDVIDSGRQQSGGGTSGGSGSGGSGSGGGSLIDLSGAKSQIEADRLIEAHLLANGLTRDSAEFAAQSMQLRTENNVGSLPIR